jgi:hypothetical protein
MKQHHDRRSQRIARAVGISTMSAVIISCNEPTYSAGDRNSSSSTGGKPTDAGGGSAGTSSAPHSGAPSFAGLGHAGTAGIGSGGDGGAGNVTTFGGNGVVGSGGVFVTGTGGANTTGGLNSGGGSAGAVSVGGQGIGGSAGAGGGVATAGVGPCGIELNSVGDRTRRKMLLRDEGASNLAYIDVGSAANSWIVPLAREQATGIRGRDIQLVGNCRVMLGTDAGYEEYDIRTGERVTGTVAFVGTLSAQRLRNKNTVLVGVGTVDTPFQGSVGIVLVEINAIGSVVDQIVYSGTYAGLARPTPTGTFLVANNTRVFEGDAAGNILATTFTVATAQVTQPHAWKALRAVNGSGNSETVVAAGYLGNLIVFNATGTVLRRITGGNATISGGAAAVNPYFFADVRILANGNYLVANLAAQGPGHFTDLIPILEYTPAGALAWYWGDPAYAARLSSIQGVIALDGLDPSKLHVEDTNGQLVPVD